MTISHSFRTATLSRFWKQKASAAPTLMNFLRLADQYFISKVDYGRVILIVSLGSMSGLYTVKYMGVVGIGRTFQMPPHLLSPLSLTR